MPRTSRVIAALLLAGGAAIGISPAEVRPAAAEVQRSLADVRRATARYHDVQRALADGYVATEVCVPGMGRHYGNPERVVDPALDLTEPEVLIYQPLSNGTLRLVAVEWLSADPDQDVTTDDGRPSILGVPFDGPMLGHEQGMPVHFDLHAWIWHHNPAGIFTGVNPKVTCPA